jgi:hypothetical protein
MSVSLVINPLPSHPTITNPSPSYFQMLDERTRTSGPGSSVIVLIAPGTRNYAPEITKEILRSVDLKIRIATVTYPGMYRERSLDWIAQKTNGAAFTVTEARQNMASSYISTYFKLTNVLYSITEMYYQGSRSDLPMEVSEPSKLIFRAEF